MKFKFKFRGITGIVDGGMVFWGGSGFQIEAAGWEMRRAIDRARPSL